MRAAVLVMLAGLLSGCGAKEGDFAIEMPKHETIAPSDVDRELVALEIRLEADDHGNLSSVLFRGRRLVADEDDGDVLKVLNRRVREIVENGEDVDSPEYEAVIHMDRELNYAHLVDVSRAISGYEDANGDIHRLVERIRFAPPNGDE